jgi:hypothetical protein
MHIDEGTHAILLTFTTGKQCAYTGYHGCFVEDGAFVLVHGSDVQEIFAAGTWQHVCKVPLAELASPTVQRAAT